MNCSVQGTWQRTLVFDTSEIKIILIYIYCKLFNKKKLTRVFEFSFFVSGVKMMAGSISSKHLSGKTGFTGIISRFSGNGLGVLDNTLGLFAGDLELTGSNLVFLGESLEFLDGCLEFLGGCLEFLGGCLEFLEAFPFCLALNLFLATQLFNCLKIKKSVY